MVKQGTPTTRPAPKHKGNPVFANYMFNTAKFTYEDITRLQAMCSAAPAGQIQVWEGTDDDFTIIAGLVEGTVACRRMPAF